MAVETFRQRSVEASGQTPGYLQVSYDPDAFGASIGRALQQFGQTSMNIGHMANELDRDRKGNNVLQTMQKAKDEVRTLQFDPDYGVLSTQGAAAMDAQKTTNAGLDNIKKKYLDGIEDPEEKRMFEKLWLPEAEQAKDTTARHQLQELGNYKVQTAKGALAGAITDAYNYYNDDKALAKAIDDSALAIDANAAGLDPKQIAQAKDEARSNIYLAAVSRWAGEDPYKALDFYEKHKDDFSGKDHITANSLVNTARDTRKAEENVQRIVSGGGAAAGNLWSRVIQAESGGDNSAISPTGAAGVAQVQPGTARELLIQRGQAEAAQMSDKQIQTLLTSNRALGESLGQTYLNQQLMRYDGDVEAALVAYNAGPGSADKWLAANVGKRPGERTYDVQGLPKLKSETEGYVQKILGADGASGSGMSTPPGYRMTRDNWSLKHFKPEDLMAPTAGGQWVDARAAQGLDSLYERMEQRFPGLNISVNEQGFKGGSTAGFRRGTADPADNPHVSKSQHLQGRAFDVQVQAWSDEQKAAFITEARKIGFTGFGFYGPGGHLHIDMGRERTWGAIPEWAKGPLGTPAGKGPGIGSSAEVSYAPGGQAELPSSSSGYYGMGAANGNGAFVSTKAPDLNSWLAQADTIADPGERERTKASLRALAAQQEQDNKASVAALKQQAWDEILAGGTVAKLPVELLSQLEPSFVSSLNTFQENRAKGSMPQDWNAWAKFSNTPQEEIARMDIYTELRNKLDDQHFDQALSLQREALKATQGQQHDASLLDNTRSVGQIISDIADAQGWKSNRTAGATKIAQFSELMDKRILAAQQEAGKKLNATEIQDIADKLLIKGVTEQGTIYNSRGLAMDASKPDEFIAASSWDQVQQDDQQTLIDSYENYFGGPPDQEAATDLYNRAMRVWLGGSAEGPDEEKQDLRDTINKHRGTPISDRQFDNAYRQWLLTFLGGRQPR